MKKNEIFTFTAPNGAEVVAVCLKSMGTVGNMTQYLCYGQNRLFTMNEFYSEWTEETGEVCQESQICYGEILVDYAILPDYDVVLGDFCQHEEEDENKCGAIDEKTKQRQIKEAWNSYSPIEDYYYPIEECFPRENYLDNWMTDGYYIEQIADDYNKAEEERCPINTEKY